MPDNDVLIDEDADEFIITAMQEKAWQIKDELKIAKGITSDKQKDYEAALRKENYLEEKLLSIAKFLNRYDPQTYDWVENMGVKEP